MPPGGALLQRVRLLQTEVRSLLSCQRVRACLFREEWLDQQFRDCNGVSNGIDLPREVLQLENSLGGVAGEALGAEKTFDIANVGGGAFGPGF